MFQKYICKYQEMNVKLSEYFLDVRFKQCVCHTHILGLSLSQQFAKCFILIKEHCIKSVPMRSYSGPYFPAFELNTEYLSVFTLNAGKCQPEQLRIPTFFTKETCRFSIFGFTLEKSKGCKEIFCDNVLKTFVIFQGKQP